MKLAAIALLLGAIAGVIGLPMPLEDAFRAARGAISSREAPGDVVVVAIDDATLKELDWRDPTRTQHAEVVSRLIRLGAPRVVFDRAHSIPGDAKEDRDFARMLERFKGRVWLGATPYADNGLQQHAGILPAPAFRERTQIASMMGRKGPFGLSVHFPTSTRIEGKDVPSISAVLAEYRGPESWYRTDPSIDMRSIPTVSYADVLFGRVGQSEIADKSVVIAPTHLQSDDLHQTWLGDVIPGVYYHAVGAHTLKEGLPIELGWYPAMLIAALIIAIQARRTRPSGRLTIATVAFLAGAPLLLDQFSVYMDIFPALIALGIASWRLHRDASRRYESATNLLKLEAAASEGPAPRSDVYAIKLQNLRDFREGYDPFDAPRFMERLAGFLASADPSIASKTEFAFEKDTLVWSSPALSRQEVEEHGEGLLALVHHSLHAERPGARLKATLGIDVNRDLDLRKRIDNAMRASDHATERTERILISDAAQVAGLARARRLATELEQAMADATIGLGYQPKVDLASLWVVGVETLLRWEHAELGPIRPDEAIRVAEDYDLIDDLTLYISNRALRELSGILSNRPGFKIAVNVSARTLAERDLARDFALMLSDHGISGDSLIIEVTESILLDEERTRKTIANLMDMGVRFSIDDFGTGYSNLEYIKQLPSAELKIDRRFVTSVGQSHDGEELVRGTIELAHSVSKKVVAEGIETKEIADRLAAMGCDMGQGFYFSRAVPADELEILLRRPRLAA